MAWPIKQKIWKWNRLTTTPVRQLRDIQNFFDQCAQDYREQHGDPEGLFRYRMQLIRDLMSLQTRPVVLEIGCGTGAHLMALSAEIEEGVGVDLSPAMIATANERSQQFPQKDKLRFQVDNAEQLSSLSDHSFDLVLCIGALEHMPDQAGVLSAVFRVLKTQGRFICLTPNGGWFWYQRMAPFLRLSTKHLSTDRFLTPATMTTLLKQSGLQEDTLQYWTFIPKGDMPPLLGKFLAISDAIGRELNIGFLRGGLSVCASKPGEDVRMDHS